jgi:hypothetical protein
MTFCSSLLSSPFNYFFSPDRNDFECLLVLITLSPFPKKALFLIVSTIEAIIRLLSRGVYNDRGQGIRPGLQSPHL